MFDSCIKCGSYAPEDGFELINGYYVCSCCGHQHPFSKQPLYVVVGAPGTGKSTLASQVQVMVDKPDVVFLEADYLSALEHSGGRTSFINHLLLLSAVIARNGRPVVLFSGGEPWEYEQSDRRNLVSEIYFLAVVCGRETLRERVLARPQWRKAMYNSPAEMEQAIESYADGNQRFIDHVAGAKPPYSLLDTSSRSREDCAEKLFDWIREKAHGRRDGIVT